MKTSARAKRCPECGKAMPLKAALCSNCGHQFRTHFEETVERTQAVEFVLLPQAEAQLSRRPSATRTFHLAFLSSFVLVACAGGLFWLLWSAKHSPAKSRPMPAVPVTLPDQALHLYNRIGMAMSLYDLDQAAGGTGRVIHRPDPSTLLLSYDYPKQRVQVFLVRTDMTGTDYRVQAVALYQGKTLLFKHTDFN
ncbi:MAG: hypothetical protein ACRYFS_21295 [Janthinobacterium lividum]